MVKKGIVTYLDSLANEPRRHKKSHLPITERRIFRFEILEREGKEEDEKSRSGMETRSDYGDCTRQTNRNGTPYTIPRQHCFHP